MTSLLVYSTQGTKTGIKGAFRLLKSICEVAILKYSKAFRLSRPLPKDIYVSHVRAANKGQIWPTEVCKCHKINSVSNCDGLMDA